MQASLLSTKILPTSAVEQLVAAGWQVQQNNWISTKVKPIELQPSSNNIIVTSLVAANIWLKQIILKPQLANLKFFCVGKQSSQLLQQAGCKVIYQASYADELANYIIKYYAKHSFSYTCGNLSQPVIADLLQHHNINLELIEIYQTSLTAHKILQNFTALMFFSPSAIKSYLSNNQITQQYCLCIGATTAQALPQTITKDRIIIAKQPSLASLITESNILVKRLKS